MPDEEMGNIILNVFGKYATPYKRYCRMMYWMPKFKNLSPWPLPDELPNDALELAKLAIKQVRRPSETTYIPSFLRLPVWHPPPRLTPWILQISRTLMIRWTRFSPYLIYPRNLCHALIS